MLKYITDDDYMELLDADSIPDNFNNLVIEASSYINRQTHGRIDPNNIPEQVKYVTCLIVNLISERETKLSEISGLKSQNIEGWSESYATPEEVKADCSNKMQSVLSNFLWDVLGIDNKPLLYRGVDLIE